MALLEFKNKNKYGTIRKRIIYSPTTSFGFNPKGFGSFVEVRVFRYEYKHPHIPPLLIEIIEGSKFIVPGWIPVLKETTLEDINWIKPKSKEVPLEKNSWKYESSSEPGSFYIVRQRGDKLTCNCSGFFRVKDKNKGCKHIQETRLKLK